MTPEAMDSLMLRHWDFADPLAWIGVLVVGRAAHAAHRFRAPLVGLGASLFVAGYVVRCLGY